MSVKARNRVVDYLVYLGVRAFVCVVQAVPMRVALGFASCLAWVIYTFDKRHRVVAAENLIAAFPEKPEAEIDRLVRGCYRHFCSLLIEIILLPRKLSIDSWRSYGKLVNANAMMSLLMSDRPLLMVTATMRVRISRCVQATAPASSWTANSTSHAATCCWPATVLALHPASAN